MVVWGRLGDDGSELKLSFSLEEPYPGLEDPKWQQLGGYIRLGL